MSKDKQPPTEAPARTKQDVVTEHNNLAFRAGILQYEASEKASELKMVNETLRALNLEYNKFDAAEKAQAAQKAAEQASKNAEGKTDEKPKA